VELPDSPDGRDRSERNTRGTGTHKPRVLRALQNCGWEGEQECEVRIRKDKKK
jgi:hypothetical protein